MDFDNHNPGQITRPTTVDIPLRKLVSSAKSPSLVSSPLRNYKDSKDYSYDSDSDDPYAGDHFRMYEFKIRRCTRSRSHDWTDCPFSHPGEKARRRDPRRYNYTGEICPEFQHGGVCSRGDDCGFSHGVFECWLHPNRYRTEACKDGKHCKRKVCFFAHSPRQLRILPPSSPENFISGVGGSTSLSSPASMLSNNNNRCCLFCSHSPTSTLLNLSRSPSSSPPLSPANNAAAFSRLSRRCSTTVGYKDVLNDLISSLDFFSFTEAVSVSSASPVTMPVSTAAMMASSNLNSHHKVHNRLPPWLDVGERDRQSVLSPSSTSSYFHSQLQPPSPPPSFFSDEFTPRGGQLSDFTAAATAAAEARNKNSFEVGSNGDLDLGWVNDLLT